jgi:hypothetical protein
VFPRCGTESGRAVAGTGSRRFAEIDEGGHAPGALKVILRRTSSFVSGRTLLTPTTQNAADAASDRLSTPVGAHGPVPPGVPVRLR